MDDDLDRMSREQLIAEVKKLRGGIRAHRDSTGHELCWHDPALWACCQSERTPCPPSQHGQSSSATASSIGSPWRSTCRTPRALASRFSVDSAGNSARGGGGEEVRHGETSCTGAQRDRATRAEAAA
jgi:hypothetical protein